MSSRRDFLLGAAAPLLLLSGARAWAGARCVPAPKLGANLCKTYINFTDAYQETWHASHEPGALWVACVAVVFATYGHVIQQPRIAAEGYGDFSAIPADSDLAIAGPLARTWKDDDGVAFRASFEPVFNGDAGGGAFDAKRLIGAISDGDPLILLGGDHAVVLTALAYTESDAPGKLVAGFVFDPMPMVGPRALDPDEVLPRSAGGDLLFAVRTRLVKI